MFKNKHIYLLIVSHILILLPPILIVPFITRVFSVEKYGSYIYLVVLSNFIYMIIEYGYNWSLTHKMTKLNHINKVFWYAIWSQIIILGLVFIILISIRIYLNLDIKDILSVLIILLSFITLPYWYYHGKQNFISFTCSHLIGKSIGLISVFIVIDKESTVQELILYFYFPCLLANFSYTFFHIIKHNIKMPKFKILNILIFMKIYKGAFFSKLFVSSYTILLPLLVSFSYSNTTLGFYNIADRIRQITQSVITPFSEFLFSRNKDQIYKIKGNYIFIIFLIILLLCSIISYFSNQIILIIAGEDYMNSSDLLKTLIFIPPFIFISNYFGLIKLFKTNMKLFNKVIVCASIFCFSLCLLISLNFDIEYFVFTVLICEVLVSLIMLCVSFYEKNIDFK